jgi:two-component system, NarL family, sensor kinase
MILVVITITTILLLLVCFIISMLFIYQKKQITYSSTLEEVKSTFEKILLSTKLEIQEETFQNISREIHDNISLSLTLAKLHLNTLDWTDKLRSEEKINSSIQLLSKSIYDLSDISKGLDADIIIQQGITKALEYEVQRILQTGFFSISYTLTGNLVYMDAQKELIIFRIVQEAFNNIIKHAQASHAELSIHYNTEKLFITINDNGNGFHLGMVAGNRHAGLRNMETRAKMLQGTMKINSLPGKGTSLSFTIPLE